MTTIAIVFHRTSAPVQFALTAQNKNGDANGAAPLSLFTYSNMTCHEFCANHNLNRLEAFVWAVGDAGRKCVLLECNAKEIFAEKTGCTWMNFPTAAKTLTDGNQKRLLQLAVQYLSSDGVDNSVSAAIMDDTLKEQIKNFER